LWKHNLHPLPSNTDALRAPTRSNNRRDTGSPHSTAKAAHRVYQRDTGSHRERRTGPCNGPDPPRGSLQRRQEESRPRKSVWSTGAPASMPSTRDTRAHANTLTLSKAIIVRAAKRQVACEEKNAEKCALLRRRGRCRQRRAFCTHHKVIEPNTIRQRHRCRAARATLAVATTVERVLGVPHSTKEGPPKATGLAPSIPSTLISSHIPKEAEVLYCHERG